jgi:hypothetical protein
MQIGMTSSGVAASPDSPVAVPNPKPVDVIVEDSAPPASSEFALAAATSKFSSIAPSTSGVLGAECLPRDGDGSSVADNLTDSQKNEAD